MMAATDEKDDHGTRCGVIGFSLLRTHQEVHQNANVPIEALKQQVAYSSYRIQRSTHDYVDEMSAASSRTSRVWSYENFKVMALSGRIVARSPYTC